MKKYYQNVKIVFYFHLVLVGLTRMILEFIIKQKTYLL